MFLLHEIEHHLYRMGVPATRFGRQVMRDPRFVHDLRNGRRPRIGTERRVIAFLSSTVGSQGR